MKGNLLMVCCSSSFSSSILLFTSSKSLSRSPWKLLNQYTSYLFQPIYYHVVIIISLSRSPWKCKYFKQKTPVGDCLETKRSHVQIAPFLSLQRPKDPLHFHPSGPKRFELHWKLTILCFENRSWAVSFDHLQAFGNVRNCFFCLISLLLHLWPAKKTNLWSCKFGMNEILEILMNKVSKRSGNT